MADSKTFAVMVLAAGGSSRLGRPKQLLPYLGHTLVEHATRTALDSGASQVVVVVGADREVIREKLQGLPVQIVDNAAWPEGMGGSIRCGVRALEPDQDCVVIALCDQPRVTPDHLRELATRQFETGFPMIASSYDGVVGVPCAFGSSYFSRLLELKGDGGARELIRGSIGPVESVPFSGGLFDVDTAEDYARIARSDGI